ncbi:phosphopeptide-binding protein [Thioalkalivibrio denitrificans]|uniref:Phosphopeptide-binding protein n=1 Tax=Thioalkalivibrio denitrificans TaxID=108003 RepID=A0A1V3NUS5_9GAMM|nr:FHA domain-containing protein [Thioalkalivibrio denitrificans]OOG28703.1 phosphopeptide-binding protein [Thioalkalivibrio denitrificans]
MARLIVYLNDQFLQEVSLDRKTITIGRKPDNDVHLDNHAVSGYHAQIITLLNDSFLEDLDSTNGTTVNDKPIRKRALKEGDEIGIYHYRLVYTRKAGSVQPVAPAQMDKTMIIRMDAMGLPADAADRKVEAVVQKLGQSAGGSMAQPTRPQSATPPRPSTAPPPAARVAAVRTPAPSPAAARPAPGTATPPSARLEILTGPNAGRTLELSKPLTTLGKPGIQVAAIQRRIGNYMIIHVDGGASGASPKVNDEHIGNASRGLKHGDTIDIAGVRMKFLEGVK